MEPSHTLRVSIFQSDCAEAAPSVLIAALDAALAEAPGADLMVCPEMFLGGYRSGPRIAAAAEPCGGAFAQAVGEVARRHRCAVAYGYAERSGGLPFNAAAVIGPDGRLLANHRKRRLPNAYEKQWFQTGDTMTFLTLGGWKIAVVVCYEVEFPETVRSAALAGAHLTIVPTALSSRWPVVARQVVPARAFENGLFVAYANHTGTHADVTYLGESCIAGPDGRDLERAGAAPSVIAATLDPAAITAARQAIPFLTDCAGLAMLPEDAEPRS